MTPLHQIKRLAGSFVFNQFLYPRENPFSDTSIINDEQVSRFLINLFGNEKDKTDFALNWCKKRTERVLDLANGSQELAIRLVSAGIPTTAIESSLARINALRNSRELLDLQKQSIFQIYPLDLAKFEVDETYQTVFAGHQALEQSETELTLLGTLRNVLAHLNPDGSFFVELHNLDFLENQWNFREGNWSYVSEKFREPISSRVWEKTYPGSKESQTVFEYAIGSSLSEFSICRSTLHLFNQDQWMKLFEVAGFLIEDCYGNWQKAPVSSQLPQLIFHLKAR